MNKTRLIAALLPLWILTASGPSQAKQCQIAWNPPAISSGTGDLSGVAWGAGRFVAVGHQGSVSASPTGTAWTSTATLAGVYFDIARGGNKFVAVGADSLQTAQPTCSDPGNPFSCFPTDGGYQSYEGRTIAISPNGKRWTPIAATGNRLLAVAWGRGRFVAVGDYGAILTSPTGKHWTARPLANTAAGSPTLTDIARGHGRFVVVGIGLAGDGSPVGTVLTSPDGLHWTGHDSGTDQWLMGVAWGAGKFVAVGAGGTILTSPDGAVWDTQTSNTTATLYGVAWGAGRFVAMGDQGALLTSPDGVAWTLQTPATSAALTDIAWAHGRFVGVGQGGTILVGTCQ